MTELNVDGMALAPGVVETIVSIAANEVEGVACIGPSTTSGLRSVFGQSLLHTLRRRPKERANLQFQPDV